MTDSTGVEKVIEVASRLKNSVAGLYAAYQSMAAIIAKETRAVQTHDFPTISAVVEEKTLTGDRIEGQFSALIQGGVELNRLAQELLPRTPPRDRAVTLRELAQLLAAMTEELRSTGFAAQVLEHVAKGFAEQVETTLTLCHEVKPLVEGNRHLVAQLLRNFQESYRFWQEVTEQIAVSYNASGVQKAAGRNSGFKVRA